jgi:2-amino-4-hydroxy-6-hydroxymethyldihydropteridine diphosphokinase / dihydropteroate synthase
MIILGLGSNIGERMGYLMEAVSRLSAFIGDICSSRVFESRAVLPADAPNEWDTPFLNMAIAGECELEPEEILQHIKKIERDMGREIRGFWGPREIDIDILAMDDVSVETPQLHIPHHELLNRDFALVPLVDVAPDWRYPGEGSYHGWRARDVLAAKGYKISPTLVDKGRLVA